MGGKNIEPKNFDGRSKCIYRKRNQSGRTDEGSLGHFGKHARYAKHIWSGSGGAAVKSDKMFAARGSSYKM